MPQPIIPKLNVQNMNKNIYSYLMPEEDMHTIIAEQRAMAERAKTHQWEEARDDQEGYLPPHRQEGEAGSDSPAPSSDLPPAVSLSGNGGSSRVAEPATVAAQLPPPASPALTPTPAPAPGQEEVTLLEPPASPDPLPQAEEPGVPSSPDSSSQASSSGGSPPRRREVKDSNANMAPMNVPPICHFNAAIGGGSGSSSAHALLPKPPTPPAERLKGPIESADKMWRNIEDRLDGPSQPTEPQSRAPNPAVEPATVPKAPSQRQSPAGGAPAPAPALAHSASATSAQNMMGNNSGGRDQAPVQHPGQRGLPRSTTTGAQPQRPINHLGVRMGKIDVETAKMHHSLAPCTPTTAGPTSPGAMPGDHHRQVAAAVNGINKLEEHVNFLGLLLGMSRPDMGRREGEETGVTDAHVDGLLSRMHTVEERLLQYTCA